MSEREKIRKFVIDNQATALALVVLLLDGEITRDEFCAELDSMKSDFQKVEARV